MCIPPSKLDWNLLATRGYWPMLLYSRLPSTHLTPRLTLAKVLKDLRGVEEMEFHDKLGLVSNEELDKYEEDLVIRV